MGRALSDQSKILRARFGSHIAKLSEDFAAAIRRPVRGRWWLIMHALCIGVILSNLKYTHPLCFFNAWNWKLMNEYGSDLLFVVGTLKRVKFQRASKCFWLEWAFASRRGSPSSTVFHIYLHRSKCFLSPAARAHATYLTYLSMRPAGSFSIQNVSGVVHKPIKRHARYRHSL